MNSSIDGSLFRQMIYNAAAIIETHKENINELNVFPVPDGDTGTNMSMTLNAALGGDQKNAGLRVFWDVPTEGRGEPGEGGAAMIIPKNFN